MRKLPHFFSKMDETSLVKYEIKNLLRNYDIRSSNLSGSSGSSIIPLDLEKLT